MEGGAVGPLHRAELRHARRAGGEEVAHGAGGAAVVLVVAQQHVAGSLVAEASRAAQGHAADLSSSVAGLRLVAEADGARATTHADALSDMMRADGVDTDREMENLLNLERAYAANAKVLKAVDDMLLNILGLT